MGLFSSKKIISVASTVYNLAGPEENRSNFLKSTMLSSVMADDDRFMGEDIVGNHLKGPGIRQRNFFNWAVRNDFPGLPTYSRMNTFEVDASVVESYLPGPSNGSTTSNIVVQSVDVGDGDYTDFAYRWILQNRAQDVDSDWAAEYLKDTHEIFIQFEDTTNVTFDAAEYDYDKRFLVVYYLHVEPSSADPVVEGTLFTDETDSNNLPDISSYTQDSQTNTGSVDYTLETTVTEERTYSDSTPSSTTVNTTSEVVAHNGLYTIYKDTQYNGGNGLSNETSETETTVNIWERRHIVTVTTVTTETNGTETLTTTTEEEVLEPIYDYRTDNQEHYSREVIDGPQMYIYEIGTGNDVLDALTVQIESGTPTPEYFPYIPLRRKNKSIAHADYEDTYTLARQAYRKASGNASFEDLVSEIDENEDIDDIDHAYIVFGVPLNVKENACRQYLYQFFKNLIPRQAVDERFMRNFRDGVQNYETTVGEWETWRQNQNNPSSPEFNNPPPTSSIPFVSMPTVSTIRLKTDDSTHSMDQLDFRLSWIAINEEFFTGLGKPDAKKNEVWFEKGDIIEWIGFFGSQNTNDRRNSISAWFRVKNQIETTYLYWQTSETTYKRLTIYGAIHRNVVYKGKSVDITAHEALDDPNESGFIVCLHNPTIRAMRLVDSTQMATANTFIVFNSYEVTKRRWWQSFLGMLLIITLVIVVAVIVAPASIASATGLLGTNAAVGASLGLTGSVAIIAGAVTNALAAILVTRAITDVSVAVFGEKWGAIIGAIASFALNFGITNGFQNLTLNSLIQTENIMAFTNALANGYSGWVEANIMDIQETMEGEYKEYEDRMDEIQDLINGLGFNNDLLFEPMSLIDSVKGNDSGSGNYLPETVDEFIHRTTMTGSDIVDLTLAMVTDYPKLNLVLPKN